MNPYLEMKQRATKFGEMRASGSDYSIMTDLVIRAL